jgi:hypothetical protein
MRVIAFILSEESLFAKKQQKGANQRLHQGGISKL